MKYIIFSLVFVCGSLIGWFLCRSRKDLNEEEIEANGISTPPNEEEKEDRTIGYLMWTVCLVGWGLVIGYLSGSVK